jgi:transposase-like protein
MPKKQWSPEEKLQIVLEALKEDRLISDIASEYGVHHSAIHRWKNELLDGADKVFNTSKQAKEVAKEKQQQEKIIENLYAQVGRLTTQLEWLKKKSGGIIPPK